MAHKHTYAGLVLMLTILGSLFAVAAIALAEAFVTPNTLLVLTQGEYETLAIVTYLLAVILYFGGDTKSA